MEHSKLLKQYMVVFDIPSPLTEEFLNLVPEQRSTMEDLFTAGVLMSYTVALDKTNVWALFLAQGESDLLSQIDVLPLSSFMDFEYHEIMFHNTVTLMPSMSLN